jgi:hypothetical protein
MTEQAPSHAESSQLEPAEKRSKLGPVLDAFLSAMQAERTSAQHVEHAQEFNRRFRDLYSAYPGEDVSTLASRIASLGVPYRQALADVVYLRGLGYGETR